MKMTEKQLLEHLNYYFFYSNGKLFFRNNKKPYLNGRSAGSISLANRCVLKIKGYTYFASRLIFFIHKGYFPEFVDHINLDKTDDRIENLRAANRTQNNCNKKSLAGSSSKYLGVRFRNDRNRSPHYVAQISANKKVLHLGQFKTEAEAALCYNRAAVKYHGEFANLNIIK